MVLDQRQHTHHDATVVAMATALVLPWAMMICSSASLVLMKNMVRAWGTTVHRHTRVGQRVSRTGCGGVRPGWVVIVHDVLLQSTATHQ